MGRERRPYLPGAVFHLTTRTQGHEPWFTPITRTRVVDYLAEAIRASDARLLAYAIMPNHLHIVLQQGRSALERVMQPFLRRVAALVQRSHGVQGHVFERRFGDHPCLDPHYARTVIVYTNLNPVRAGLVEEPQDYAWSSHPWYLAPAGVPDHLAPVLAVDDALRLFAPRDGCTRADLRAAYVAYVEWRMRCARHRTAEARGEVTGPAPPAPALRGGDRCWSSTFAPLFRGATIPGLVSAADAQTTRADLAEIAKQTLAEQAPHIPLDLVRSAYKGREVVRVRRVMIRRMSAAGHRGTPIACYLRVGQQCVSRSLRTDNTSSTPCQPPGG